MLDFKPQNAKGLTIPEAVAQCKQPVLEPKLDGWRMIVQVTDEGVQMYSRNGKPYHRACPQEVLDELAQLPVGTVLDGEVVDLMGQDCTAVTNVFGKSKVKPTQEECDRIHYVVFDQLAFGPAAESRIEHMPLCDRRAVYTQMLAAYDFERVVPCTQTVIESAVHAEALYEVLISTGYEGAMIKDLSKPYAKGKRGHGWFKIKDTKEIDVVIMSMELDGKGQHEGKVGRFIVGQYRDGELVERAKVNPYDDAMRNAMSLAVIQENADPTTPNHFIGQVCTIKHYGELKEGVRHPVFQRWREDKPADECQWDKPQGLIS